LKPDGGHEHTQTAETLPAIEAIVYEEAGLELHSPRQAHDDVDRDPAEHLRARACPNAQVDCCLFVAECPARTDATPGRGEANQANFGKEDSTDPAPTAFERPHRYIESYVLTGRLDRLTAAVHVRRNESAARDTDIGTGIRKPLIPNFDSGESQANDEAGRPPQIFLGTPTETTGTESNEIRWGLLGKHRSRPQARGDRSYCCQRT
jgi:hypothetical protein